MKPPALPSGLPTATTWRPMGGGSICDVWHAELSDGRAVVVKQTPYPPEVEADGLQALSDAGAPVPEVIAAEGRVLVLAHVEGSPDWAGLGRRLAAVHAHTGDSFGWHRDNLIGSLPQRNERTGNWASFFAEYRIRPYLDTPALPGPVRERLERALDGPLTELLDHGPPPSLVHGDLWSGNVVDGWWLIDPAVCYADRELELAFMETFGGFPPAVFDAYAAEWPLPEGWQARRPALALYHLLVHVELFGSAYAGAVKSRLDALGW